MTELTDEQRKAKIARQIVGLQAEVAERLEAIDNLKAKLAELVGETTEPAVLGDADNGFQLVTVFTGKAFNEAYGKKNAPELWEQHAETKKVLTSARAKDVLTDEEYARFQKPNTKTTVKVELAGDE